MTAAEVAQVAEEVRREREHEYAPDIDRNHDRWGCDTRDHRVFDHNHVEDVFPY